MSPSVPALVFLKFPICSVVLVPTMGSEDMYKGVKSVLLESVRSVNRGGNGGGECQSV